MTGPETNQMAGQGINQTPVRKKEKASHANMWTEGENRVCAQAELAASRRSASSLKLTVDVLGTAGGGAITQWDIKVTLVERCFQTSIFRTRKRREGGERRGSPQTSQKWGFLFQAGGLGAALLSC